MLRFYLQVRKFRFLEQEIFVFIIFETESEPETEVLVPYVGETKFCQVVFVGCIVGTVTLFIDVDIIVLEHI